MEKNLTSGSVFKNMMLFSLPYLLSYFLQTLYGMADLFIIGQFEGVANDKQICRRFMEWRICLSLASLKELPVPLQSPWEVR